MTRVQSVARVAARCWSVVKVATSDVPRKVRIRLLREPFISLLLYCASVTAFE